MDTLRGNFADRAEELEELQGYDSAEYETGHDGPPANIGMDERRMQVRAYNHWASLLEDRNFPAIDDLEPNALPDFGPFSVLLDFTNGIEDPGVAYLGEKLAEECGTTTSIQTLSDVPSRSLLSRITDHYMQILANQAPIGFEAEFVNQRGITILYRGILLPFSTDDDSIDFIYGVINWKEMADQKQADELLLEIDQALEAVEPPSAPLAPVAPMNDWADGPAADVSQPAPANEDEYEVAPPETYEEAPAEAAEIDVPDVLDLESIVPAYGDEEAPADEDLPKPSFGFAELNYADDEDDDEEEDMGAYASLSSLMPSSKSPITFEGMEDEDGPGAYPPAYPAIDDEEPEDAPVAAEAVEPSMPEAYEPEPAAEDEVVEPLSEEPEAPVAYEPQLNEPEPLDMAGYEAEMPEPAFGGSPEPIVPEPNVAAEPVEQGILETEAMELVEPVAELPATEIALPQIGESEMGLGDWLASAREFADAARSSEDRTRGALYEAISKAYDFSIAADEAPEEFTELLADAGLTAQDRAPMTPVVKLVFGVDYDKTRLTEYASALSHAHRIGLERGGLATFLKQVDGGLKGVVKVERRIRKEESGKTVEPLDVPRERIARKLRRIQPRGFDAISADGQEFALVIIRRTEEGEVVMLGEVPDDVALVERAAKKLLG
jgi:hypothetical protein